MLSRSGECSVVVVTVGDAVEKSECVLRESGRKLTRKFIDDNIGGVTVDNVRRNTLINRIFPRVDPIAWWAIDVNSNVIWVRHAGLWFVGYPNSASKRIGSFVMKSNGSLVLARRCTMIDETDVQDKVVVGKDC